MNAVKTSVLWTDDESLKAIWSEIIAWTFELLYENAMVQNEGEWVDVYSTTSIRRRYGIEMIEEKINILRKYEALLGQPGYIEQELDGYEAVTVDDIWRVYEKYIKDKKVERKNIKSQCHSALKSLCR